MALLGTHDILEIVDKGYIKKLQMKSDNLACSKK